MGSRASSRPSPLLKAATPPLNSPRLKPEAAGERVFGHNRCFGGLTCQGGRLEGWRSQGNGGSAPPFAGTAKLRLDSPSRGWEVGGLRRSPCSHHLLVVPQNSADFLSEGQRSPTKTPECPVCPHSPFPADLETQGAVVLHTSETEVGGEEEGRTSVGRQPGRSPASQG